MAKKIRLQTISLGSEPDQPDISVVSEFVREHRGLEADLISCMLVSSLAAQKQAQISFPCAGGLYTLPRYETAIRCTRDECHQDPSDFIADARIMVRTVKRVRSALPAPDRISSAPKVSDEDRYSDFCDLYSSILRSMRDAGITGHVLHTFEPSSLVLELLGSGKTLFVNPEGNTRCQGLLLEYQDIVVLQSKRVGMLPELIDQYDIRSLMILDPDPEGIVLALRHLDPDQVSVAGYGTGSENEYWKKVSDYAEIRTDLE